jgi:cation:H+ antiporter
MRVRSEVIGREVPLMIAVTLLAVALLWDGELGRLEGALLVLGAFAYIAYSYWQARSGESITVAAEFDAILVKPARPVWQYVAILASGLGGLIVGAGLLLKGASFLAASLGVSEAVIGLTVVAIGTSLPELATSIVSSLRSEADVAFGNVVGSNVLNLLAVLGTVALIRPFETQGLRPLDLAVMLGSAVFVLPLMWRGSVLTRWNGGILLGGYLIYLGTLAV